MAEIINVTSEALQVQIRDLLPSQAGFGEDLQASNVIMPIIDLTRTAEGSSVPDYLQNALAFGSQTNFEVTATTTVLVNTPGFYRVIGSCVLRTRSSSTNEAEFQLNSGLSSKVVQAFYATLNSTDASVPFVYDFNVFLSSGVTLSARSAGADAILVGSTRQIADVNGTLVNPDGFSPQ